MFDCHMSSTLRRVAGDRPVRRRHRLPRRRAMGGPLTLAGPAGHARTDAVRAARAHGHTERNDR